MKRVHYTIVSSIIRMKHFLIYGLLCTVSCSKDGETSGYFLDRVSDGDINAVRLRLSEERERRLLLENDVQLLTLRYAQLQRLLNQDSVMSPVGFVAKLSAHTTIQNGEVLKLDKVDMNEGNGYIPALGVFRVPVRGMYMFSITAMTRGEGFYVHIVLMNGDKELTRLFSGDIGSGRMVGAVSVPAILSENDNIFIKAFVTRAGLYGEYFTSFTGLLIQRMG